MILSPVFRDEKNRGSGKNELFSPNIKLSKSQSWRLKGNQDYKLHAHIFHSDDSFVKPDSSGLNKAEDLSNG